METLCAFHVYFCEICRKTVLLARVIMSNLKICNDMRLIIFCAEKFRDFEEELARLQLSIFNAQCY